MNAIDEWPSCIVERFDRRMTRLVTLEIQALATSHQVVDAKSSTDCASTKTRDSGQNRSKSNGNWIQRQFRDETKPSKHRFGSSEQTRRTSLQRGDEAKFYKSSLRKTKKKLAYAAPDHDSIQS